MKNPWIAPEWSSCEEFFIKSTRNAKCKAESPSKIGNGDCDDWPNNTPECGYVGGHCVRPKQGIGRA
jgi:hypothetical protein